MRTASIMAAMALVGVIACSKEKKEDKPATTPPAPKAGAASTATAGEGIGEDEEGAGPCDSCTTKGTACVNDVCRLKAQAYWRVSLLRVDRSTPLETEDGVRLCIKPSRIHTWTCSRELGGDGKTKNRVLTKHETFTIDITTEDIQSTGIDIQVTSVHGDGEEKVIVDRKAVKHLPIRAGELLFKGGLRYGMNDAAGFSAFILKFGAGDGSLEPKETPEEPKDEPDDEPPPPKKNAEPPPKKDPNLAGWVCGGTAMRCDDASFRTFAPHELPFHNPGSGTHQSTSRHFYAVMLGSVPHKGGCNFISEGERLLHQKNFPHHRVFTSRNGCDEEPVSYTNINPAYNFMAVYAGESHKTAVAMLDYVKSLGKYNGPNIRHMQVQLTAD
jgi:hypothetical protein